jgi:sortase B
VKKKILIRVVMTSLLAAAALGGFFYVREYMTAQEEISEYDAVQSGYTSVIHSPSHEPSGDAGDGSMPFETAELPYVAADFDALLLTNPDTVGWVAIPGSVISYPVVQAWDNTRYLGTSFQGKRSVAGTPFADKDNDMRVLDANTIIYGHNMGAGRQDMFGSLLSYKDYDYYAAHRYIQFDTVYRQHSWWKVFAVIEHDMRSKDFNYLELRFGDANDFMDWAAEAMERSVHDSVADISDVFARINNINISQIAVRTVGFCQRRNVRHRLYSHRRFIKRHIIFHNLTRLTAHHGQ